MKVLKMGKMSTRVDRNNPYYKACLVGTTGIGTASGGIVGGLASGPTFGMSLPVAYAAGTGLGFVVGYLLCPYMKPAIKNKFDAGGAFDEFSMNEAIDTMQKYAGISDPNEAVKLLSIVRSNNRPYYKSPVVCAAPHRTAKEILSKMI